MNNTLKNCLKYAFFFGLAILLAWLPLRNLSSVERQQILDSFNQTHGWVVIPVFIAGLLSHLSRARRWQLLIGTTGSQPPLNLTFYAVMIGYMSNLALPRLGELLRCGIINRYEGNKVESIIGTMLIERLIDVLFLLLIIVITAVTQSGLFLAYLQEKNISFQSILNKISNSLTGVFILILCVIITFFLVRYFIKKYQFGELVKSKWVGFKQGFGSIGLLQNKTEFWFHSTFIWLMYLAMMYMAFWCMDATSHLGLAATFSLLAFGSIGMLLTQGGVGAYPLIIAATLVLYAVPFQPIGLAFGWIIWAAQTVIVLILGSLSLILLQTIQPKSKAV